MHSWLKTHYPHITRSGKFLRSIRTGSSCDSTEPEERTGEITLDFWLLTNKHAPQCNSGRQDGQTASLSWLMFCLTFFCFEKFFSLFKSTCSPRVSQHLWISKTKSVHCDEQGQLQSSTSELSPALTQFKDQATGEGAMSYALQLMIRH